jgi:hypothetical protein
VHDGLMLTGSRGTNGKPTAEIDVPNAIRAAPLPLNVADKETLVGSFDRTNLRR